MVTVLLLTKVSAFLLYMTIFLSTTQGRTPFQIRRLAILSIICNDKCEHLDHAETGNKECMEALHNFRRLSVEDKSECPNASDAICRTLDRGQRKCSFKCDPTSAEVQAASNERRVAHPTIKTLHTVAIPMINIMQDLQRTQEEFHGRRLQQQLGQHRLQHNYPLQQLLQLTQQQIQHMEHSRQRVLDHHRQQLRSQHQQRFLGSIQRSNMQQEQPQHQEQTQQQQQQELPQQQQNQPRRRQRELSLDRHGKRQQFH